MQVRATLALYEESSANTVTLLQSLTLVPPSFCLVAVAKGKEKKSATGNCSPAEITTRAGSEREGCGVYARALNSESGHRVPGADHTYKIRLANCICTSYHMVIYSVVLLLS